MSPSNSKNIFVSGAVLICALSALGLSHSATSKKKDVSDDGPLTSDSATAIQHPTASCNGNGIGIPNPADKYCIDMGYDLESESDADGGQHAVCIFPDDSRCDTWAFLEGRCGREFSICAASGLDTVTSDRIKNAFSKYTALCVEGNGTRGSVPQLMGFKNLGNVMSVDALKAMTPVRSAAQGGAVSVAAAPPSTFDWRSEAGEDWTTPPKNQSQCGSCWAFSVVGAIESAMNVAADNPGLAPDLSEEYLVSDCPNNNIGSCCGGAPGSALQFVVDAGIPDENCMPYDVGFYNTAQCSCGANGCDSRCPGIECSHLTCSQGCSDMNSRLFDIEGYTVLPQNRTDIQDAMVTEGGLSAVLAMSGEFDADGIYRCTTCWDKNGDDTCDPAGRCDTSVGRCVSGSGATGFDCTVDTDCDEDLNGDGICSQQDCGINHAIVLVGYDDNDGHWIAKNSWGNTWNGDGFFNIGYNECHIEEYVLSVQVGDPEGCTCPSGCDDISTVSAVNAPFVVYGAEDRCFFFNDTAGSYINSWNVEEVNLNGMDITGRWIGANDYPAKVDGGYYLYVLGNFPWSQVEVR